MTTDPVARAVIDELRQISSELAALREHVVDMTHTLNETLPSIRDALVQLQKDHEP